MKKRTKVILPTSLALAVGVGAFVMFGELGEETHAYRNYETKNEYRTGDVYQGQNSGKQLNRNQHNFNEAEGKVISMTKNKIIIDTPFQGEKTFAIDKKTRIEKKGFSKIAKNSLVEIDAIGKLAYKIETEKSIETEGTIIKVTNKDVTAEQNGKKKTFKKAANFHIDAEDYRGTLEGVQAEFNLNAKFQVKEIEIDIPDDDDGDDD